MSHTIAAIATGRSPSAIGILRLSGPDTFTALDAVFRARNGRPAAAQRPRSMVLGDLLDGAGRVIDNVLCVTFPAPHSYTGEDCAELHCHGSPVVLDAGLRALFAAGCRQAQGGEFTKRAFLSGQLDLLQAEAVADLIDAETAEQAHNAVCQLSGTLSRTVDRVYEALLSITARFYAVVDYPDEDIEDLRQPELLDTLHTARQDLERLLTGFSRGQLLKQGVPTVLLGKPNAGKSSLLNALLGYDRAIVTDIAGTTRDTVEEKLPVGGVLLRLTDTAGIRDGGDAVEALGVERSRAAARQAALAILVLDGSSPPTAEDEEAIALARQVPRLLVVMNKCDLPRHPDAAVLTGRFDTVLSVSARENLGLDALTRAIAALFPTGAPTDGALLTNARQADAVSRALSAVTDAHDALQNGMTPDAVLTDCEAALEALGELNGKHIRDDLVDTIFSRFCVGK
ncbi:MAG: tRNA uridine-5-carboxymethylaminomethyl(34) synthesis GTPase MnmE [Clostridiales bacterium]|nr:tRNA uridine-5-carboxymethylaminomethyl(34) synthesis GTPase MnmE [Clostridiales bacterium]